MSFIEKNFVIIILSYLLLLKTNLSAKFKGGGPHNEFENEYNFLVTGGYRPSKETLTKYIVSIRIGHPRMFFGDNHSCGGSIISPNVILTAAHCLCLPHSRTRLLPHNLMVVAGTPKRCETSSTTQIMQVKKIIRHSYYKPESLRNDIGIIILLKRIIEDELTAQRISIAKTTPPPGTECTVIGWGRVFFMGPIPNQAFYANITLLDMSYCKSHYAKFAYGMLCAGDLDDYEKDACSGDSGGPLICHGTVVGIVSFGAGCGFQGHTGYYTEVSSYIDWIRINGCCKLGLVNILVQIVSITMFMICM